MRHFYAIGETLLDLIFKSNRQLFARPGGAMLNTSISLGRLDLPISLLSEIGDDPAGNYIMDFLQKNHVNTDYCFLYSEGQTALALAFLDENENARYSFYKNYPPERMKQEMPVANPGDIVLFGSFFAITREVRSPLMKFIAKAKHNNAIILYDPNFRKPHLHELSSIKESILENISHATIIRGSDEDFQLIFDVLNADQAFDVVNGLGCSILIYTAGDKPVEFRSANLSISVPVPQIKPLSTIGAGDSFNAGLIYNLYQLGLLKNDLYKLEKETWESIIQSAASFGSHVCCLYDNYISIDFANQIKK